MCRCVLSTALDGPVVPEVKKMLCTSHGSIGFDGATKRSGASGSRTRSSRTSSSRVEAVSRRLHPPPRPCATSPFADASQPVEQRAVRDHELRIDQTDHMLQDRAPAGRVHRDVDRAEHDDPQHEPHHGRSVVQPHQHPIAARHPERLERGGGPAGDGPGPRTSRCRPRRTPPADDRAGARPVLRGCTAGHSADPPAVRESGSAGAGSSLRHPGAQSVAIQSGRAPSDPSPKNGLGLP